MMVTTKALPCHILDLNDDCLEDILSRLDVIQQYQISKLHSRFNQIVNTLWRGKLNEVTLSSEILQNIDDQEFVAFMQDVSVHMKSLQLQHCDIRFLRLLSDQVFAHTETFIWLGQSPKPLAVEEDQLVEEIEGDQEELSFLEEDLNVLNGIFPNLKVLKLKACQITGKYLAQFPCLKQLSLNECQCLESDNFRDIFQELKLRKFDIMEDCDEINCCDLVEVKNCSTLEHIKIADYHLCFDTDIINDILGMPRLKKLSIYSKNFVFDVMDRISRTRLKSIVAFKFNGVLHNFDRFFRELTHMRLLKKLSFYNCHGNEIEGLRDHLLVQISKQFTDLEEIHLCSCDLESDKGILSFVQNCHQLRLVNVTSCRKSITDSLVWRCIDVIKKQKWRTTDLELYLGDTDIERTLQEDPRYMHNNRFLKLNFNRLFHDSNPPGVLKFTFTT